MIIVYNDRRIGLLLSQPFMDRIESIEEWLPVRIFLQALFDDVTDGRNMGCGDCVDDLCHLIILSTFPLRLRGKHLLELVNFHSSLLRADILHAQPENSGELCEIIDVVACLDHRQNVTITQRPLLLLVQLVFLHVCFFIGKKGFAIGFRVEGKAHLVQGISFTRLIARKDRRAENIV